MYCFFSKVKLQKYYGSSNKHVHRSGSSTPPPPLLRERESAGLEVIKLEYSLKLKINPNDWLLADMYPQVANHCALFEFENEFKFYNLDARLLGFQMMIN